MANSTSDQAYEDMSRDELVALIGMDVSPDTPRSELITMARNRSQSQNQQSSM